MKNHFYIVDVFIKEKYSGNPLAVVINEKSLSDETMQKVAAEMNFSETTFVNPIPEVNGGYRVRIYTPSKEIAFAGHPILGTAYIIRQYIEANSNVVITLNLMDSEIPVTFESLEVNKEETEIVWFTAPTILLTRTVSCDAVAYALGIRTDDIETKAPIQMASAGTSALVVPLRSLDALRRCKLNLEKYAPLLDEGFPPLIYLFTEETHAAQNDLCVRFFFDAHGVREDPATGNGAAFLGEYLLEQNYFSKAEMFLRIEQGYEVHRPSLVMLKTRVNNGLHEIKVGGRVLPSVQGELV